MGVPFHKMHGAGNDFILLDEREAALGLTSSRIAALADRHTGIGCDQVIVIRTDPAADAALRFFNPDGGESAACGNGTRCAADLLMHQTGIQSLTLQTLGGTLAARRLADGQVCVDMGPPSLEWDRIPLSRPVDTLRLPLPGEPAAASMGNPHVTFFDVALDRAAERGPAVQRDELFPEGVNVGFAQVLAPDHIRLRVWERGAGLTLACGSGACAALVNAHRRGLARRRARIVVDGGALDIFWREDDHVEMSGPVATAFRGSVDLQVYAE